MITRSPALARGLADRAWLCGLGLCCALLAGCATCHLPRIDPSGERILVWPNSPPPTPPPGVPAVAPAFPVVEPHWGISVSPASVIAPVGTEVVMIASVCGPEGFMITNERVEWMLAPEGVGQFMNPGERHPWDLVDWMRGLPKKVDNRYAVNRTYVHPMTLDRGTPSPADDVLVQSGQSWVSVTSPSEGTSRVTVFAPKMVGWDRRQQTATIYWVDAQWRFPPPAITAAGGSNTLTTTLSRQSDNSPLPGWRVRYEIVGGPAAGFAPAGDPILEVASNESGEATVEIVQKEAAAGTNQVQIQVIRPAGLDAASRSLPVGSGSVLQTWTGSEVSVPTTTTEAAPPVTSAPAATAQLDVSVRGPSAVTVGSNAQFEIQVFNRSSVPARRLLITDRFDAGLEHAASGSPIEKELPDLQPGGVARFAVTFRVAQAGELCQEIEVNGEGGVRASTRSCVTATGTAEGTMPAEPGQSPTQPFPVPAATAKPTLTVRKTGADSRHVGETVEFTIDVSNNGSAPLENLLISTNFESSLHPENATEGFTQSSGGLNWRVNSLAAGRNVRRQVIFSCTQEASRACNRVTVTASGIEPLNEEVCLEIMGASGAPAAATPAVQPLVVTVAETAAPIKVGGETTYQVVLTNQSSQSQFSVALAAALSSELKLKTISGPGQGTVLPGSVRFPAIAELRAGEKLSYEFVVQALKEGAAKFRVDVTSRGQTQPVTAEKITEILP